MPSFKLQNGQDIRRVTVEEPVNFTSLTHLARKLFSEHLDEQPIVFQYKDGDRDLITVTGDLELEEAFRLYNSDKNTLKLKINSLKGINECPLAGLKGGMKDLCAFKDKVRAKWSKRSKCGKGPGRCIMLIAFLLMLCCCKALFFGGLLLGGFCIYKKICCAHRNRGFSHRKFFLLNNH